MVSGLKRSGKDYISLKLQEAIPNSKIISLASPLKDIIALSMGISKDDLEEYKNLGSSICVDGLIGITNFRTLLQQFGTEAMKKWFGDDVWVNLAIKRITELTESGVETIIISDWRFRSEYNALARVANVITLRVEDSNLIADSHISEHDLDNFNFDFTIDNTIKDGKLDVSQKLKGLVS